MSARRDRVQEGIGAEDRALVDVRSPQEYAGELVSPPGYEQEGALRAGHIPTAQSIPWAQAVGDDGTCQSVEELRELYESKGVTAGKEVTAYCRIGERSAHTWFVLRELLGYEQVKNYDGSWTECGNPCRRADRAKLVSGAGVVPIGTNQRGAAKQRLLLSPPDGGHHGRRRLVSGIAANRSS